MKVRNTHSREITTQAEQVGWLIDTLASTEDRLWPTETWPRMRLDRPLSVGAVGGHGPIRYTVTNYEPGRRIGFTFTAPRGFDGTHSLRVDELGHDRCRLTHDLQMTARGWAALTWPLVYRPLHDALIEDALTKAERQVTGGGAWRRWSVWVRLVRWILGRAGRGRQMNQQRAT